MLTVHYTLHASVNLPPGFTATHKTSRAREIIRALENQLGNLESLTLPHHVPELGITITTVTESSSPVVVVTVNQNNE